MSFWYLFTTLKRGKKEVFLCYNNKKTMYGIDPATRTSYLNCYKDVKICCMHGWGSTLQSCLKDVKICCVHSWASTLHYLGYNHITLVLSFHAHFGNIYANNPFCLLLFASICINWLFHPLYKLTSILHTKLLPVFSATNDRPLKDSLMTVLALCLSLRGRVWSFLTHKLTFDSRPLVC